MFIKYIDFLSPPITFYYHGSLSHTSIISGILSIISIAIIITLAVYSSLGLIKRQGLNAFYFNSFVEDAGIFPLNASSLFHFISMATLSKEYMLNGFDFTNFRIVGYETYFETYFENNLNTYDHWIYGLCNNESDSEGISYLTNYDFFEKSACIRYYFSFEDQKYYNTGDKNFRWPRIAHGTMNDNIKLYSIVIGKCSEDTLNLILGEGYHCKSNSEIDELLNNNIIITNFYFINNYINVLNYENPNTKFFYRIENGINKNQYSINNLNFNPAKIKTHKGLFFDNIVEEDSYVFDRNDEFVKEDFGKRVYVGYSFWLKNTMNFYERTYKKIQDILSFIGGINQVIIIIAFYINSLYNNYIVLSDTEKLLFSSIHKEKRILKKKKFKYGQLEKIKKEVKKEKQIKSFDKKINTDKSNRKLSKSRNEEIPFKINNNFMTNYESKDEKINSKKENNELNTDSINYIDKINKGNNFWNYISFKFICKKSNNFFYVYNNFRKKIISEEHLIRNHLNIYNLIKFADKKRYFRRNSYQIKDLVKLV